MARPSSLWTRVLLLLLRAVAAPRPAGACPSDGPTALQHYLTGIGYDPKSLPAKDPAKRFEWTTVVTLKLGLESVSELDTTSQTYVFNIDMRMGWYDPRIQWDYKWEELNCTQPKGQVVIKAEANGGIWQPDITFENARDLKFVSKDYDAAGEYTQVVSSGEVTWSVGLVATLRCEMDFHDYPFDSQECFSAVSSYAFNASSIQLQPGPGIGIADDGSFVLMEENIHRSIGAYHLGGVTMAQAANKTRLDRGEFSRVVIKANFRHAKGRVFLTILVPLWLIVIISVIGLYIDNTVAPARVALGITTVLVLITLLFTFSKDVPIVVYATQLDCYIVGCLAYVVFNCAEYALINYLSARIRQHNEDIQRRYSLRKGVAEDLEPRAIAQSRQQPSGFEPGGFVMAPASAPDVAVSVLEQDKALAQELFEEFKLFARPDGNMAPSDLAPLLKGLTQHHNRKVHPADLQKWINDADLNGDGNIDFTEFKHFVSKELRWLAQEESRAVMFLGRFAVTYARVCQWEDHWRTWSPLLFILGTLCWLLAYSTETKPEEAAYIIVIILFCISVLAGIACTRRRRSATVNIARTPAEKVCLLSTSLQTANPAEVQSLRLDQRNEVEWFTRPPSSPQGQRRECSPHQSPTAARAALPSSAYAEDGHR